MQFRNMFDKVFGNKEPPKSFVQYKMLNDYAPVFTPFSGDMYDNDTVRTCIDAIARNGAKLKGRHIRRVDGEINKTRSKIEWMLQVRPNPFMNGYDFLYKAISQLFSNNNAFIYIHTEQGVIKGFYPLNFSQVECVEYMGDMYCKFTFMNGFRMTVPYSDIIHLRRHFNRNDFWGEGNNKPLIPTLNLLSTINQGIINAIRSSARLRGVLKFSGSSIRPEDLKAQRDLFVTDYLSISNDGGIAATDAKAEFIPMETKPQMADDKQMAIARDNAYRYFGVSEKIINNTYSEDEFNAFYSSVLEPIAIQLSLEFTEKCFTDKEKGFGNEIIFNANRLTFANIQTKVNMAKELLPYGLLTINEMREIFENEPVEGGDKRIITLNVVDADKQNQYQVGEEDNQNADKEQPGV